MLHTAPVKDILNRNLSGLKQKYRALKGRRANPDHIKMIDLIQSFTDENDREYNHNAALGICVYSLLKLGSGYELFYGEKEKNLYRFFGGQLGPSIQECIDITYTNSLNEQNALIYLTDLYYHLKKFPRKIDGREGDEHDANVLLKEIGEMIKNLLVRLSTKRPTYTAIVDNFASTPEKYKELGGTNSTRERYAQFIKILNEDFKEKYILDSKNDKEWTEAYSIRYGALLYKMEKIKAEYSVPSLYSPEHSHLYKVCMSVLNVKDPQEVPDNIKRKYYIDFLSYIFRITLQPQELERWENQYHFPNARTFFEDLQNGLAERTVELIKKEKRGAVSLSYFDIVSSATASYLVTLSLGEVATRIRLSGSAIKYFSLLRPEAALMLTLLAFSLNAIITTKTASAINRTVVNGVSATVIGTFDSIDKMGSYCHHIFYPERGKVATGLVDNADFSKALTIIPDEIFTTQLKNKMQYLTSYQTLAEQPEKTISIEQRLTL